MLPESNFRESEKSATVMMTKPFSSSFQPLCKFSEVFTRWSGPVELLGAVDFLPFSLGPTFMLGLLSILFQVKRS